MGLATILILSITALTAAASGYIAYDQNQKQIEAQEDYNEALEKEAIRQYQELDQVESDTIYDSHAESLQAQKDYMEARSSIELQAAVTGTYGNSINLAIQDLNTGYGGRMAEITYNRESKLDQIDRQAESSRVMPGLNADRTIHQPSWYAGVSTGMSTGVSTYSAFSGMAGSSSSASKASKGGSK